MGRRKGKAKERESVKYSSWPPACSTDARRQQGVQCLDCLNIEIIAPIQYLSRYKEVKIVAVPMFINTTIQMCMACCLKVLGHKYKTVWILDTCGINMKA